jgi:hypothetical protein
VRCENKFCRTCAAIHAAGAGVRTAFLDTVGGYRDQNRGD